MLIQSINPYCSQNFTSNKQNNKNNVADNQNLNNTKLMSYPTNYYMPVSFGKKPTRSEISYETACQKYGPGFWIDDHTWKLKTGEKINISDELGKEPSISSISSKNEGKKNKLENIFRSTMKEIHLENSTDPKVQQIEKEMKNLGIQVTFEDDIETAQKILKVCKKLKSHGVELPKEIILMTPQNDSINGFTPLMKKGYEKQAQIFIKKGLGSKTQLSNPFFETIGMKHFTDDTPAGTFTHELGHWHHNQNLLDDSQAKQIWSKLVNNENKMDIAQKVSVHAMTDDTGKEFVAEVYAGMCKGEKYDDEVMNIYFKLNGPKI